MPRACGRFSCRHNARMKPTLVLLHGLLNNERVWAPVVSRLGDAADIRIPNLRRQHTIAHMSRDAWAELADVPAASPVLLAGFSMGGYVAQQMLADAPRVPAGLALVDTSCRPEPAENLPAREATMAGLRRDVHAEVDTIIRRGVHPDHLTDEALLALGRSIMLEVGAQAAIDQLRAIIGRADHRARLATLNMPVLVLCGREDQVTPLALSREAAALIPGAELVIVEGAGHWTPLEQPDELAAQLLRWLRRCQ